MGGFQDLFVLASSTQVESYAVSGSLQKNNEVWVSGHVASNTPSVVPSFSLGIHTARETVNFRGGRGQYDSNFQPLPT